jgi:hypothetical protein
MEYLLLEKKTTRMRKDIEWSRKISQKNKRN